MPYKSVWVEPEIFLEYKGVKVYHTYEDDDIDNPFNALQFTLRPDRDTGTFNVQHLDGAPSMVPDIPNQTCYDPRYARATQAERMEICKAWDAWYETGFTEVRKAAMCHAIDIGDLK